MRFGRWVQTNDLSIFIFGFFVWLVMWVGSAHSYVRQRYYDGVRTEVILHWPSTNNRKIYLHNFSGNLQKNSSLSVDDVDAILTASLQKWLGPLSVGASAGISFDLDSDGGAYLGTSACEYALDSAGNVVVDGVSNLLFTSKVNAICADEVPQGFGVIGLTKVRVSTRDLSGEILDADIQFNDKEFQFSKTGAHNLNGNPKIVNLNSVVMHELGHFFGLDHVQNRQAAMLFAVSEGMDTLKSDDELGLLTLYPTSTTRSQFGRIHGSVVRSGEGLFGASVSVLNAETLEVTATELSDVNGEFQICTIPQGSYVAFARSYEPRSAIHRYFSGADDGSAFDDDNAPYNPRGEIMVSNLPFSFWADGADSVGMRMKIARVLPGQEAGYLNISGGSGSFSLSPSTDTELGVGEVRALSLSASPIPLASGAQVGSKSFSFRPRGSSLRISTASLSVLGRMTLTLTVRDSGNNAPAGCVSTAAILNQGKDPFVVCTGLDSNSDYTLQVTGTSVPCAQFPGNPLNCRDVGESSTHSHPFFLLSLWDPGSGLDNDLTSGSAVSNRAYTSLQCDRTKIDHEHRSSGKDGDGDGACCAMIADPPGGPGAMQRMAVSAGFGIVLWALLVGFYLWMYRRGPRIRWWPIRS